MSVPRHHRRAVPTRPTDGGGWTKVTTALAGSLAANVGRNYLYLYNARWYRSPCSTLVWTWPQGTGQELIGTYAYYNGTLSGTLTCSGSSSEKPCWGVGCSSGGGQTAKVLPIYNASPSTGESMICQDVPNAFGASVCPASVAIFEREGCTP